MLLQYGCIMNLPARALQEFQRLFDQQMWAFGRDVSRPDGNLLARRGFERGPAPIPGATSSLWRLHEDGLELQLSSLGVRATTQGRTVFLDRDPMAKVLRGADPLPLTELLQWFSEYERWVELHAPSWRAESLGQRSRRAAFPAETMASRWHALAELIIEHASDHHLERTENPLTTASPSSDCSSTAGLSPVDCHTTPSSEQVAGAAASQKTATSSAYLRNTRTLPCSTLN